MPSCCGQACPALGVAPYWPLSSCHWLAWYLPGGALAQNSSSPFCWPAGALAPVQQYARLPSSWCAALFVATSLRGHFPPGCMKSFFLADAHGSLAGLAMPSCLSLLPELVFMFARGQHFAVSSFVCCLRLFPFHAHARRPGSSAGVALSRHLTPSRYQPVQVGAAAAALLCNSRQPDARHVNCPGS